MDHNLDTERLTQEGIECQGPLMFLGSQGSKHVPRVCPHDTPLSTFLRGPHSHPWSSQYVQTELTIVSKFRLLTTDPSFIVSVYLERVFR